VLRAIPTSSTWRHVLTSEAVWADQCAILWHDKVWVPERFHDFNAMSRISAYFESLADAQRDEITPEELCAFNWSVRMKGHAGGSWTQDDPWWKGQPAATRTYTPDGTCRGAKSNGTWRFPASVTHASRAIRHSRDGVEFPTHFAMRYRNWGWVLQNCWSFGTSFPLPRLGDCHELEDDGEYCSLVSVASCRDEAMCYNAGMPLPPIEQTLAFQSVPADGAQGSTSSSSTVGAIADGDGVESAGDAQSELMASLAQTWALFERFDRAGRELNLAAACAFAALSRDAAASEAPDAEEAAKEERVQLTDEELTAQHALAQAEEDA